MERSESIENLVKALAKVRDEMPSVKFDSFNPFFKSKYASLKEVMATAKPFLVKHKLVVVQTATSEENRVGVTTTLCYADGNEWIQDTVTAPITVGSANPGQEAGKLITYLRRYSYATILGQYAEEDNDNNQPTKTTKESVSHTREDADKKADKKVDKRPYTPVQLRTALKDMVEYIKAPATDENMRTLAILLGDNTADVNERHALQLYLFGKETLTTVERKLVAAGLEWLSPQMVEDDYLVTATASKEIAAVVKILKKNIKSK